MTRKIGSPVLPITGERPAIFCSTFCVSVRRVASGSENLVFLSTASVSAIASVEMDVQSFARLAQMLLSRVIPFRLRFPALWLDRHCSFARRYVMSGQPVG